MAPDDYEDGWAGLSGSPGVDRQARVSARNQRRVEAAAPGDRVRAAISEVGERSVAGLACPKCGGTAFKAKRSRGAKLLMAPVAVTSLGVGLVGVAALRKTRVKCVTCGTEYLRG